MERVKDYEEEGVKEVAGHELPGTFEWQMFLSARRSIPGSIFGIVTYSSTFKGGSAMNCFSPPSLEVVV
jgi:hypothetical protein